MRKHLITAIVACIVGMSVGSVGVSFASTPRPSGYCTKAELGKVKSYTTPTTHKTYKLKCVKATTQRWKKA